MSKATQANKPGQRKIPRVALVVETSRTYGRGILEGIAKYARVNGPWSFFTTERELHSGVPDWLMTWKGDGIIARIEDRRMAAKLLKLGCPVVDVLGQARVGGMPWFDTNANAVAQAAADFFLRAGFEHFAYIGYAGIYFSDLRGAAFTDYLAGKGKAVAQMPHLAESHAATHIQAAEQRGLAGERGLIQWLKKRPRPLAVLACNDVRAQQVLNACREHGIRVPEEVAVMGVDNDNVLCNLCDPPLTSIEPDTERIGHEAAALLARLMAGETAVPMANSIPPLQLVERTSTDVIVMQDPVMVQAIRFIRNEVGNGIAVKDVLSHVNRSRTALEQRFQQQLQTSVHAEILRRRMERVASLLRETNLPVIEVARKSGFATAAHLCRLFRQHFQTTPTEFRAGR
jgi:LacI family transcriptional regulator